MEHKRTPSSFINVDSFTTLPRKRRDRLPSAEELEEMSLERRLATLNITQSRPVPPPRLKRYQKRSESCQSSMTSPPNRVNQFYKGSAYSFDESIKKDLLNEDQLTYGYSTKQYEPAYHKYEMTRKDTLKDLSKLTYYEEKQPMCDIIESSQQSFEHNEYMGRPDILRGSFNADLESKNTTRSSQLDSYHRGKSLRDTGNYSQNAGTSSKKIDTSNRSSNAYQQRKLDHHVPKATSTPNKGNNGSSNRFMFYRPKTDKPLKPNNSAVGLVGMGEVSYEGGCLIPSPEGSFVNPAFDIADRDDRKSVSRSGSRVTPISAPPKLVYSTLGSSFSARPCTPSPPSQRFRNSKPPILSPEPEMSPIKSHQPPSLKPMLSKKQIETSLKQYSSQTGLNTSEMCSPQALENMMKYYNMSSTSNESQSESPPPPPMKLSKNKKNESPYSSTGSLNIYGDNIDSILRRKKKVKIRPPSFSSEDDIVKRVSLEINLTPNTNQSSELNSTSQSFDGEGSKEFPISKSLSISQTSLNQVEKLELDDLTSTEAARLLRKQFAKLKVKANSLKVKDTELKQRFAHLQSQRGRVCGHGGNINKTKLRNSAILL